MSDISNRGQKSADLATTYIEVLITLCSGIIAAVLAFYPELLKIQGFNFFWLKISLVFFGFAIISGLFGLGALITKLRTEDFPAKAGMLQFLFNSSFSRPEYF